jgi:hypothetical protein
MSKLKPCWQLLVEAANKLCDLADRNTYRGATDTMVKAVEQHRELTQARYGFMVQVLAQQDAVVPGEHLPEVCWAVIAAECAGISPRWMEESIKFLLNHGLTKDDILDELEVRPGWEIENWCMCGEDDCVGFRVNNPGLQQLARTKTDFQRAINDDSLLAIIPLNALSGDLLPDVPDSGDSRGVLTSPAYAGDSPALPEDETQPVTPVDPEHPRAKAT